MSMEDKMWRNLQKNAERNPGTRIIPPSEEQRNLTEKWILPYSEAIVEDLEGLRKEVDAEFSKDPDIRARMKKYDATYPYGVCGQIRTAVVKKLRVDMQDRSRPGLQALKGFVRQGGFIHGFWGVDKGIYFQNAIQVGDSIFDVANDTVDRSKPPVVFYPNLENAPLKNIQDFTEFADVATSYWKADVYPNIYLPELAPIYPAISILQPRGTTRMEWLKLEADTVSLALENATTRRDNHMFGLSSDFIFNSPYSEKRLPDNMVKGLFESEVLKKVQAYRPEGVFDVTADPERAREVIASFHVDDGMKEIPEKYFEDFEKIEYYGSYIGHVPLVEIPR